MGVLFFEKMDKSYAYEMIVIFSVLMTYLKLDPYQLNVEGLNAAATAYLLAKFVFAICILDAIK